MLMGFGTCKNTSLFPLYTCPNVVSTWDSKQVSTNVSETHGTSYVIVLSSQDQARRSKSHHLAREL